ncbi:UDP-N-acetylmuramoylalanine--D-glutamate ligase [Kroppenstedtia guangzhouensis]|uniref:UDP-N-acetylmuramoylalanine--D-glutamate ligase n=1 Tax=Kroppenstedtia guangzhouensis TaxID=1274356 RepID=A0ABQ1FWG2_9BACL|nr:UDP-N-acetylmuramoyl-L-alanine--D-glutamate ligase [Kroppenstedtia guangzhouensis]GGA32606.1 UDP-N-acetylmuramoylalanine--D-glutamate ligase [Kroppenstedtia guangzhouensis]
MKPSDEGYAGKKILVLGLARSGVAVARLLHRLGAEVTVNDRKPRREAPEAEALEKAGIQVVLGGHPEDLIHREWDLLVKNPGIPYQVPLIREAETLGIPVVTEVEIAWQLTEAPMIGITGSNGKTTTTSLVGRMLDRGKIPARVAGNIGMALSEVAPGMGEEEWLVSELSSFQLKGTLQFRPRIGALLNLFPAHLDYHGSMKDYLDSKKKLFVNQQPGDIALLNKDSGVCRELAREMKGEVWWFSRQEEVERGVMVKEGWVTARLPVGEEFPLLPASQVRLPGVHMENALAASAISLAAGCPADALREELRSFTGVEHRLEFVATIDGVQYYNDSKATNGKAATSAMESFTEPIILIAGGLDRGVDFRELVPVFQKRLKGIVTYGEAGDVLLKRAKEAGVPLRERAEEITEAVARASRLAAAGDVVLLSPACASWDLYTSFEERGSMFKQAVHNL